MKQVYRKSLSILVLFCMFYAFIAPCADAAETLTPGLDKAAENDRLILYANQLTGEIAVTDKRGRFVWRSNPAGAEQDEIAKGIFKMGLLSQLMVTLADRTAKEITVSSQTSSVTKEGLKAERVAGGIKMIYHFPKEKITIPVVYSLGEDYLKAEILNSGIIGGDELRIISISLLPNFGAGGGADSGYMMVPDGSGALIHFNNGKTTFDDYAQPVYGRDPTLRVAAREPNLQDAKLPVFGIKNGGHALLAVIKEGDSSATVKAAVGGKRSGYNTVFAEFNYGATESLIFKSSNADMLKYKTQSRVSTKQAAFEVRYYFLTGDDADYSGMAAKYQQYLVEEEGLSRKVGPGDVPMYMELFGGIQKKKYIFGFPFNILQPLTTYGQTAELIGELKRLGIGDLAIKYSGWMTGGMFNTKIPANISFEKKLGGERGFTELLSYAKAGGVKLFPAADFANLYRGGGGYNGFYHAVKGMNQAPVYQNAYQLQTLNPVKGYRWYLLEPNAMLRAVNQFTSAYGKLNHPAVAIESLGQTIFGSQATGGTHRSDAEPIWREKLGKIAEQTESVMVDSANAYAFPYVSHIIAAPASSNEFDLVDESIPFYQMALHGYVSYSVPPVNLSDEPELAVLKAIETGSSLSFSWIAGKQSELKETRLEHLYSVNYRPWLDMAVKAQKNMEFVFAKLADKRITGHRKLQQDVYETVYENGTKVIVNYSGESVTVNGKTVMARSFIAKDGER